MPAIASWASRPCSIGIVWSRSPQTISVGIELEQVEAVAGAHPLAADVDHRAQRLEEGLARAAAARAGAARGRLPGGRRPCGRRAPAGRRRPPSAESTAGCAAADEQRGGARQRRAAQQRADLAAEPAARDQREPFRALGELVEELHRHAAAERVADDRRALDADRRQQVADAGGVRAERVVAARRGRVAVADQVGRDHGVGVGQLQRHLLPVARRVDHPVDQHDGRAAARRSGRSPGGRGGPSAMRRSRSSRAHTTAR